MDVSSPFSPSIVCFGIKNNAGIIGKVFLFLGGEAGKSNRRMHVFGELSLRIMLEVC